MPRWEGNVYHEMRKPYPFKITNPEEIRCSLDAENEFGYATAGKRKKYAKQTHYARAFTWDSFFPWFADVCV